VNSVNGMAVLPKKTLLVLTCTGIDDSNQATSLTRVGFGISHRCTVPSGRVARIRDAAWASGSEASCAPSKLALLKSALSKSAPRRSAISS
jgi:hypothetical protein